MKKLLVLGFVILMAFSISGQEVVYTSQITIEWDAVAPQGGDVITYEVWINDGSTQTLIAETADLFYTITFSVDGNYILGVRTVRTITATSDRFFSDLNWSDVNGTRTPNPFIARYYIGPAAPEGLRYQ